MSGFNSSKDKHGGGGGGSRDHNHHHSHHHNQQSHNNSHNQGKSAESTSPRGGADGGNAGNNSSSGGGGAGKEGENEYMQEHELHATWVLWEHAAIKKGQKFDSKNNLVVLHSFRTVEDFWRVWSFLPKISEVSKLKGLDAFSVFKSGIEPKWEDPANQAGCELKWSMVLVEGVHETLIDIVWEDLVIACLGQILEDGNDDICGIRAVDRTEKQKQFRLELWMRKEVTDETAEKIKLRLQEAIDPGFPLKPDFKFSRRDPVAVPSHPPTPKGERGDHPFTPKGDRPERPERGDRSERPERGERPDRGERPEKAEKGEGTPKSKDSNA